MSVVGGRFESEQVRDVVQELPNHRQSPFRDLLARALSVSLARP